MGHRAWYRGDILMAIQTLPTFYNFQYVDKEGRMTSDSLLYNDQTFQALNVAVSLLNKITITIVSEGKVTVNAIMVPVLSAPLADAPIGALWYNSADGKLQFQNAAGVQTITSTP